MKEENLCLNKQNMNLLKNEIEKIFHCAASAIEALVCCLAVKEDILPPSGNREIYE